MEEEKRHLRNILLRALNDKHIIILKNLMNDSNRTLSSVLTEISSKYKIPLSTLKFNSNILKTLNLIEFYRVNGKRYVRISQLGIKILHLLDEENLGKQTTFLYMPSLDKLSREIKDEVKTLLRQLNNFHLYSSLTTVDILLGIFYHRIITGRGLLGTNLILSKGHAAPALYVILKKFGLLKSDDLNMLARAGSNIQMHVERGIPLINVSTGSLGQGLSIANGLALGMKMNGVDDYIYVIIGDGELDEGQIWEAASTSSTYGLDNIIVLIDRNGKQLSGDTESIKKKEPLAMKWRAFGWEVIDVAKRNVCDILNAIIKSERIKNWPKAIIVRHG